MKFEVTFKTPDVCNDAIREYCNNYSDYADQSDKEDSLELESDIKDVLKKFVKYDELITIEFDTETKTAKVLER